MQARSEAEIDSEILRHDARNLQLKRRLAERGIDFRGEREIMCNFRAPDRRQASLLEQRLIERGFLAVEVSAAVGRKNAPRHVRARMQGSIGQAASHEFTEMVVSCAAALSCVYDGWCTCI